MEASDPYDIERESPNILKRETPNKIEREAPNRIERECYCCILGREKFLRWIIGLVSVINGVIGLCFMIGCIFGLAATSRNVPSMKGIIDTLPNIPGQARMLDVQLPPSEGFDVHFSDFVSPAAITIGVLGVLLILVCILGIVALLCHNHYIFYVVCALFFVLFLVEFFLVILFFVKALDSQIQSRLTYTLQKYKSIDDYSYDSTAWNYLMVKLQCCGVYGYEDFRNEARQWKFERVFVRDEITYSRVMSTPVACCKLRGDVPYQQIMHQDCPFILNSTYNNFNRGCWTQLNDFLAAYRPTAVGVSVLIILLQLALIVLACLYIVCTHYDDRYTNMDFNLEQQYIKPVKKQPKKRHSKKKREPEPERIRSVTPDPLSVRLESYRQEKRLAAKYGHLMGGKSPRPRPQVKRSKNTPEPRSGDVTPRKIYIEDIEDDRGSNRRPMGYNSKPDVVPQEYDRRRVEVPNKNPARGRPVMREPPNTNRSPQKQKPNWRDQYKQNNKDIKQSLRNQPQHRRADISPSSHRNDEQRAAPKAGFFSRLKNLLQPSKDNNGVTEAASVEPEPKSSKPKWWEKLRPTRQSSPSETKGENAPNDQHNRNGWPKSRQPQNDTKKSFNEPNSTPTARHGPNSNKNIPESNRANQKQNPSKTQSTRNNQMDDYIDLYPNRKNQRPDHDDTTSPPKRYQRTIGRPTNNANHETPPYDRHRSPSRELTKILESPSTDQPTSTTPPPKEIKVWTFAGDPTNSISDGGRRTFNKQPFKKRAPAPVNNYQNPRDNQAPVENPSNNVPLPNSVDDSTQRQTKSAETVKNLERPQPEVRSLDGKAEDGPPAPAGAWFIPT